jgi:hypothetical protein
MVGDFQFAGDKVVLFTRLEDAVRHHLDVFTSARNYDAFRAGVAADLTLFRGPIEPVLARIDPLLGTPLSLTVAEFGQLVDFVRAGLLDKGAQREHFRKLVPEDVPSGRPTLVFQFNDRPQIK